MTQYVYCDGSFSPQGKVGVGAILQLSNRDWEKNRKGTDLAIRTKVMPAASIARIELMTALWALSDPALSPGVQLFTDCKMIEGLPERRTKLELNNYQSRRTGSALANADLYERFFKIFDEVHPRITWIKGHAPTSEHTKHQRLFSCVDKRARQALREHLCLAT
jgi:ribonuclease HI